VRKGDLSGTSVATLLTELAGESVTGCLRIIGGLGEEAAVYLVDGRIQAALVPGVRAQLGSRLLSCGALSPEALAEALEAQRSELQGWRLGELLIHLGYVSPAVVESFVLEQLREAVWDLLRWTDGRWRFRDGERTRDEVSNPLAVAELLGELRSRQTGWAEISSVIDGPTAVPRLSGREAASAGVGLSPDAWSLMCKIDGERTVAELARECGYTHFEVCHLLLPLLGAGIVDISGRRGQDAAGPAEAADGAGPAGLPTGDYAAALDRVSVVLAEVLGPPGAPDADPYELPMSLRTAAPKASAGSGDDDAREARHRAAAAAELAAAQREAEELRAAGASPEPVGFHPVRRRFAGTGRNVQRPRRTGEPAEPPGEPIEASGTADRPVEAAEAAVESGSFIAQLASGGRHASPPWEPAGPPALDIGSPEVPDELVLAGLPQPDPASTTDPAVVDEQSAPGPGETVAVLAEFSAAVAAAAPEHAPADAGEPPQPVGPEAHAALAGTAVAETALVETALVEAALAEAGLGDAPGGGTALLAGEQLAAVIAGEQFTAVAAGDRLTAVSSAEPLAAVATGEPAAAGLADADPAAAATADAGSDGVEPPEEEPFDTASLLRELSSLGLDEDAQRSPARPAPPPRPGAQPADRRNRRRGFFGR
jgi:hypothetical protein